MHFFLCIVLTVSISITTSTISDETCDNTFQCGNKKCVPLIWRCDSSDDCGDGSDEVGCSKPVISQGPPAVVHISLNDTLSLKCSGVGVPTPVIAWYFNGSFIPPKCITSSFNGTGKLVCENMRFRDQGTYTCKASNIKDAILAIPDTIVIVKNQSCSDHGNTTENATCKSNQFQCNNKKCIPSIFRCDTDNDCGDGSDEIECQCSTSEFQCKDKKCIPLSWRCDLETDCSDHSDEIDCGTNPSV